MLPLWNLDDLLRAEESLPVWGEIHVVLPRPEHVGSVPVTMSTNGRPGDRVAMLELEDFEGVLSELYSRVGAFPWGVALLRFYFHEKHGKWLHVATGESCAIWADFPNLAAFLESGPEACAKALRKGGRL